MSDEELVEQPDTGMSVGAQLRAAREAKGISVDDMAARSRIPKRHLENLEADNWEKLPAPTYAAGFAKSYAQMVDIDPAWAAQAVREQMGAYTPEVTTSGVYEIADEKRGIPGWLIGLVIVAIIAAILVFSWLNDQKLAADEAPEETEQVAEETPEEVAPTPAAETVAPGTPVTLVATRAVWLRITDGSEVLIARELAEGEEWAVPTTATAPMLETARPASLRARVGEREVGFAGEDGTRVSDVSLLGQDVVREAPASSTP